MGCGMKRKLFLVSFIILMLVPSIVSANSSWHWISSTRPIDILPFVILVTLLIETLMIIKLNKINSIVKPIVVIIIANLMSFVMPFLVYFLPNELGMSGYENFLKMINHWPTYIAGIGYLFMTLVIEVPIVYNLLKKECDNKKMFLKVIIAANILTTLLTALAERVICVGQW